MQSDIYEFYKENPSDKIWKVTHCRLIDEEKGITEDNVEVIIGELLFSFDRKKKYIIHGQIIHIILQKKKKNCLIKKILTGQISSDIEIIKNILVKKK